MGGSFLLLSTPPAPPAPSQTFPPRPCLLGPLALVLAEIWGTWGAGEENGPLEKEGKQLVLGQRG